MRGPKHLSIFLIFSLLIVSTASAQTNQSEEPDKQVLVELDDATWIKAINWNPQNSTQVRVVVQSEVPKVVSLQELPDYSGRSGSFSPMKRYTLQSGENAVMVPYNGKGTQGIAIASQNNGAYFRKQPNNIPDPSGVEVIPIGIYGAFSTFMIFVFMRGWSKFQLKRGLIRE